MSELEALQLWCNQLEQAWLQIRRGALIDSGMKIDQARIHAITELNDAKTRHYRDMLKAREDKGHAM